MEHLARYAPSFAGMALVCVTGAALGAFAFLWAEHGATVYMGYLAGAAFTCL